ncbi:MAG: formylglycine-generating enzyme family protein, partial [Leptolyngbyaceae bacterium]|nr:formylglycine-generating enzyme family protein [Leptolyngbyaceae bacterium]
MSDLLLEFIQCVRRADEVLSADVGLGPGVEEIADMLWLACQLPKPERDEPNEDSETGDPRGIDLESDSSSASSQNDQAVEDSASQGASSRFPIAPSSSSMGTLVTRNEGTTRSPSPVSAKPIKIPAAAALRHPLELGRSLRRLIRKTDSRVCSVIDEDATAIAIAEENPVVVIERPDQERWLDLELVVEQSKVASIWEPTVREWIKLLEQLGAFRTLRVWQLVTVESNGRLQPQLISGQQMPTDDNIPKRYGKPKELINAVGRSLVMVMSDCISPLWREGIIHEWLANWAKHGPVVVVQWFPSPYWSRTALKSGSKVWLSALSPGIPNSQLMHHHLGMDLDDWSQLTKERQQSKSLKSLVIPVVSLEPESLKAWARVVAGCGDAQVQGRRFRLTLQGSNQSQGHPQEQHWRGPVKKVRPLPESGEKRFLLFEEVASGLAKQLAGFMALGPVSPEITNLIQETLLPQSGAVQVAEVFLGGLLEPLEDGGYRFVEGVQERLRHFMLNIDQKLVFEVLSEYVSQRYQRTSREFRAFLEKHDWTDEQWEQAFESSGFAELRQRLQNARSEEDSDALESEEQKSPSQVPDTDFNGTDHISETPEEQEEIRINLEALTAGLSSEMVEDVVPRIVELPNAPVEIPITIATVSTSESSVAIDGMEAIVEKTLETVRFVEETDPIGSRLEPFPIRIARVVKRDAGWLARLAQRQSEWTVEYEDSTAQRYVEQLPDSTPLELVAIPSGSFTMGSPEDEPGGYGDERPQHEVTIAYGFFMGRYPVTQAQWRVVAALPQIERELNLDPSNFKGDDRPVERVSWHETVEFCQRLNAYFEGQSSEPRQYEYRLPSEAEWEYACRAGTTTPFHFGSMITTEVA